MKNLLRESLRLCGFDVVRYNRKEHSKTIRSNKLDRHVTKTGIFYLPSDAYQDVIANTIIGNKIYDEAIYECAKKYVQKGTAVLDVGSNFGQMAILFSRIVGPTGAVFAFDADDFIYDILKKNISENKCANIKPHFGAVHDLENSFLFFPEQDFERFGSYGSYGIDYVNNKGRKVPTVTIDSLNISEKISFMKVDVQGGDLFALRGALKTIEKNQMPIIFEFEYELQEDLNLVFQEYVDFVNEINYRFHTVVNGNNYLILPK